MQRRGNDPFPEINGVRVVRLDSYAVIPLVEYEALVRAATKDGEFLTARSNIVGHTRYVLQP